MLYYQKNIVIDVYNLDFCRAYVLGYSLYHDFLVRCTKGNTIWQATCTRKAFQKCVETGIKILKAGKRPYNLLNKVGLIGLYRMGLFDPNGGYE